MEKIFDIAKDSEKSWGVIAQGIDGNFEEVVDNVNKIEGVDVLDNLLKIRCPLILGYIGANGSINSLNLKYCRTDFIELDANGKFKIEFSNGNQKLYRVASYSGNDKKFVKLIDNYIFKDGILTFDKDDTFDYVIICLARNTSQTDFTDEEIGYINISRIESFKKDYLDIRGKVLANEDYTLYSYNLDFDYDLTKIPDYAFTENDQSLLLSRDVAEWYAKWDDLMSQYPNYVTREESSVVGIDKPTELASIPYYIYHFSPKRSRIDNAAKINVYILLGTHSNERLGMLAFYHLMRMMCENWKTIKDMSLLRAMVDFHVIPCHNPWGWNNTGVVTNAGRCNYNQVNLNRNWPTEHWRDNSSEYPISNGDWGGSSAGSEFETKVAKFFYDQIKPNVSVDIHTGGTNSYGIPFVIESANDNGVIKMLTEIGKTTSCRLVIDNDNYPDDADTNLVDISNAHETNGGVYIGEMQYYGAQANPKAISGLIECCATINYKDGHYVAGDSGLTQTQTLRENIQFEYNLLMRFIAAASKY